MENAIGVQPNHNTSSKRRLAQRNDRARARTVKWKSILDWHRILRVHYHWPLFEAIRYALWLTR